MTSPATSDPLLSAAVGLEPGTRYRCDGCGNLTRFDVAVAEQVVRFWHVDLAGVGAIDETAVAQREVASVTCRWCGSADQIVTEPTPRASTEDSTA